MRIFSLFSAALLALVATAAGYQDHSRDHRGGAVMGFDQSQTKHHFSLFKDGGAIEVTVKDLADTKNRDAIRSHLRHIAVMFAEGNFDSPMLVHDSTNVPGTAVLVGRKDRVRYDYVDIQNGGRVDIVTSDRDALAAVHAFLTFQIDEHKTQDPKEVRSR
jgi:hypothetical protein